MKKYFQIYNYLDSLKSRIAIYNLTGKADIWWQDIKRVKNIKEKYKYSSESSDNDNSPKKRKYKPDEEISGEFKKIKSPVFNGEVEKGEEAQAWLSSMKKYFQIYKYLDRLKAQMDIYNLIRNVEIWWHDIKRVKKIKEKYVTWRTFKKILQN